MKAIELKQKLAQLVKDARAILDKADTEKRGLTPDEETAYKALDDEIKKTKSEIGRREALEAEEATLDEIEPRQSSQQPLPQAPAFNRTKPGDTEARMIAHYLRTGQASSGMQLVQVREQRDTSNATDMNITTPGDGGYAVPTGHYAGIIAKRNEAALFGPLGVMPIPGKGTTVNVPTDASTTANVFVSTNEVAAFDEDVPIIGQAAMTLVKFTKKCILSDELLEDEDSNLIAFLNSYIGRALGRTHNSALVTEALANGTSVALAAAAAATAGDPETVIYSLKGEYADNAAWIMKRATEGALRKLVSTSMFLYQVTPQGAQRSLGGFPVNNSEFVAAIGAGLKSVAFGNFEYMGMRQGGLTFLRDPYGAAATGQVRLFYYCRLVYKVLQAEAILYGKHPTA